jgi:hypothetical protein
MNKKTMLIGLGVLAVAGIGYYMWKKKNETTSDADGYSSVISGDKCSCTSCEITDQAGNTNVYNKECNSVQANIGWKTITQEKDCPCPSPFVKGQRTTKVPKSY